MRDLPEVRGVAPSANRCDAAGWAVLYPGIRSKELGIEPSGVLTDARFLHVATGVDLEIPVETDQLNVLFDGRTTVDWFTGTRALTATVSAGAVTLIPASDRHHFRFRGQTTSLSVSLHHDVLRRLAVEFDNARRLPASVQPLLGQDNQRLFAACQGLSRAMEAPQSAETLLLDSLATTIGIELGRLLVHDDPLAGVADARGRLKNVRILDYIEEHLGEHIRLDTLAALAGLSRSHFVREFRALTGLSPHTYVIARRIGRAKPMLADPRVPLADIAFGLGFSSQSHFTTVFTGATGMTPLAFRKAFR